MNFGQNLYNWFLSNAQSLVLLAIVVIGLYLGFKREFSKLIGFLIIAIIAVMKDEYGNQSMVVDEVLRGRMETRLITKILSFEIK